MQSQAEFSERLQAIESMSFKEASVTLEGVVRQLESGDLELEDALQAYEYGVALLASLRKRLAEAEQKVEMLNVENIALEMPDVQSAPSMAYLGEEN